MGDIQLIGNEITFPSNTVLNIIKIRTSLETESGVREDTASSIRVSMVRSV
jgi:hypothetical protein